MLAVVAIAATGSVLARPFQEAVPPGVTIGGIDVGGMSDARAREVLRQTAAAAIARGVVVKAGGKQAKLSGKGIRIAPDIDGALALAHMQLQPFDRLQARLGLANRVDVPLEYRWNDQRLLRALRGLRSRVETKQVPATVVTGPGGKLSVRKGRGGTAIDLAALRAGLTDLPRLNGSITLAVNNMDPAASTQSATRAIERAQTLLDTKHELMLRGRAYTLSRNTLARALTFDSSGGQVRIALKRGPIREELRRLFGAAETAPASARFIMDENDQIRIIPSREGRTVDPDPIRRALERDPALKRLEISVRVRNPVLTTAMAKAMNFSDQVASYRTPYECCEPRVTNIKRAAEILDGTLLAENQTFSLNDALGERTDEAGFVAAPEIAEGMLRESVGGGVSQVATTLFNAAYFAGLEINDFTSHAFWIPRYPKGREATVSWGNPDLVFTNNWPAPLLIFVSAGEDGMTVTLFSQALDRRVEEGAGEPYDIKKPKARKILNPALKPGQEIVIQRTGADGFTIDFWRKVYRRDVLLFDQKFKTVYIPHDEVIEHGPKPEPAAPEPTQPEPTQPDPDVPPVETDPVTEPGGSTTAPTP